MPPQRERLQLSLSARMRVWVVGRQHPIALRYWPQYASVKDWKWRESRALFFAARYENFVSSFELDVAALGQDFDAAIFSLTILAGSGGEG